MSKTKLKGKETKVQKAKSDEKVIKKKKAFTVMRNSGKPTRDKKGNIIRAAENQTSSKPGEVVRVEPNRKWFGNTRVIGQNNLQKFITEAKGAMKDPYQVILKPGKLPLTLLTEYKQKKSLNLLDMESFDNTFGKKSLRNRPKISVNSLEELTQKVAHEHNEFAEKNKDKLPTPDKYETKEKYFTYGQSKRIWGELHKVVDSSDVIFQVLDARDPMGTRSPHIEKFLKKHRPFKHLVLIVNKCDLVPTSVIKSWIYKLSKEYPVVAFRADVHHNFGKSAVFQLLRQLSKLHMDKKNISVGFIGYPNVGKSSVINTLVGRKVCNVAPIPGETKVWQYISLMKRIFLIDCPGVVYPTNDTEAQIIMKGVVRAEYIQEPSHYIGYIMDHIQPEYLTRTYGVMTWSDSYDFLQKIAQKAGRLLKGGEPDIETIAKMIISDFQRGKIPYFIPPPLAEEAATTNEETSSVSSMLKIQNLDELEHLPKFNEDIIEEHVENINSI